MSEKNLQHKILELMVNFPKIYLKTINFLKIKLKNHKEIYFKFTMVIKAKPIIKSPEKIAINLYR